MADNLAVPPPRLAADQVVAVPVLACLARVSLSGLVDCRCIDVGSLGTMAGTPCEMLVVGALVCPAVRGQSRMSAER